MPRSSIYLGEHYHIFNRGISKNIIFLDEADYIRMLFSILFFQHKDSIQNLHRSLDNFSYKSLPSSLDKLAQEVINNRMVELVAFALMPNHFHIIAHELKEGGISHYLQRIEIAYTKYFNTKYKHSGYLFQGPFQSVHIEDNEQLLHLSAYVHLNHREIGEWKNKENIYPWSSYRDILGQNRWGDLLKYQIITEQFSNGQEYQNFVVTSGVKDVQST